MPLTIRQPQFLALNRQADAAFQRALLAHLRDAYAAHVRDRSDADLRDLIDHVRMRAHAWSMEAPEDIARLAGYFVLYGEAFGSTPLTAWAGRILDDVRRDSRQRLDELDQQEAVLVGE